MKARTTHVPSRVLRHCAATTILLAFPLLSFAKADTHLSDRGAAELHTMLNVARLSALPSERLTGFADAADRLYAPAYHSLLWVEHRRPRHKPARFSINCSMPKTKASFLAITMAASESFVPA